VPVSKENSSISIVVTVSLSAVVVLLGGLVGVVAMTALFLLTTVRQGVPNFKN